MGKLNIDEQTNIEVIELTLGGKEYTFTKVSSAVLNRIKDEELTANQQLGLLLDVDPEQFEDLDIRLTANALSSLQNIIAQGIEVKNPTAVTQS